MIHLDVIQEAKLEVSDEFHVRATGRYYTHKDVATHMIKRIIKLFASKSTIPDILKVIDPFSGDGRLVFWLIKEWDSKNLPSVEWKVSLWDISEAGMEEARKALKSLKSSGINIKFSVKSGDSFKLASFHKNRYDIVITNPPWELLKPDVRELSELSKKDKEIYVQSMREYDDYLASQFPKSQPMKKFAGWGTNLSRVGFEVSDQLCKDNGIVGIVLPASFFADDQSTELRCCALKNNTPVDIAYFPAEAKLFGKADISSSTFVYEKGNSSRKSLRLSVYDKHLKIKDSSSIKIKANDPLLIDSGFILPITLGSEALQLMKKLSRKLPAWKDSEECGDLWAGREIDETGSSKWLSTKNTGLSFVKGKMVNRFKFEQTPLQYVNKKNWKPYPSCNYKRIAWRDISRPNQKRRVISTIIPANVVAGNSLGVTYYKVPDSSSIYVLLGIMNSLCFEFQLRCYLATGHVSLSAIRKVRIPSKSQFFQYKELVPLVKKCLKSATNSCEEYIEAFVAKYVYELSESDLLTVMSTFDKMLPEEKEKILIAYRSMPKNEIQNDADTHIIPNHLSSKLSALDMDIVRSVPQGGNWKNIPESIPSKRIAQIRQSYIDGKGSRSTYYGRLKPDYPSYTINTYFNRPGNGCHIHYSQDRVLSQREAARLQSFPDSFIFHGSQTAVNTQIGNAVPPILAFQIAEVINDLNGGQPGCFIDLFSGAGGLGLGFVWAGWKPIVANDIEVRFLETYSHNVHDNVIPGSITDDNVFNKLVSASKKARNKYRDRPLWVLGGPPCQGFSTAGNKRSMADKRNLLFNYYKKFIEQVVPDGFVFENVAGLLNMDQGRVFEEIKMAFNAVAPQLNGWVLDSEKFAVPQRRKRVVLVGTSKNGSVLNPPREVTSLTPGADLFNNHKQCVSVHEAISDLPTLQQGQDGSCLNYKHDPCNKYQELMRGMITAQDYMSVFRS